MRALRECRLYGIIDLGYIPRRRDCNHVAEQMVTGGVDLIQFRGKGKSIDELVDLVSKIHEITVRSDMPLIVNDHAEVAARVPVEGVHVGQDDDSILVAREKAGRDLIVGKSTHNLAQAHKAQGEGADYIGFGPIFATPTKPDHKPAIGLDDFARLVAAASLPAVAIGGLKREHAASILASGAAGLAVISAICGQPEPEEAARQIALAIGQWREANG